VRQRLAAAFRLRTQEQWVDFFAGDDVCLAPVLSMADAAEHPHLRARGVLRPTAGGHQPAAAPRFSRSVPGEPDGPTMPGAGGAQVLAEWGIGPERIGKLREKAAVRIG